MHENLDKNLVYCNECLTPLKFNKKEKAYEFQCHCKDNKRFKYTLRWCKNCKEFRQFYSNLEIAKCVFEANNDWRKENPELSRQIASNGAKALAKKIKNMTKEEKIEWTKRSCNSPTANKNPESKRLNSGLKYCKKCGKETYHINNTCMKCHPSSGTGRKYDLAPIFCSSFKEENNILYYYDKSINNYISWEDYKKKFNRKRLTRDIENFIDNIKSLDIFQPKNMGPIGTYDLDDIIQLVSTFRTQDSETWEGARNAFEQNLVDLGIDWFVYIKFYIDKKGSIRPLVVGKSGSLLVNSNGSDVSFSTDINNGPARRFITETETVWDKSQILIIKAKSEKQALYYEWKISKIFGLFES